MSRDPRGRARHRPLRPASSCGTKCAPRTNNCQSMWIDEDPCGGPPSHDVACQAGGRPDGVRDRRPVRAMIDAGRTPARWRPSLRWCQCPSFALPECCVTSPFDIEEIFPEDAAGSVRLPRRQAGSSPQGLAVTLLADYTLHTRAWLPSAAIVALLAESDVSHAGARAAISRLARRGVVESSRQGRHSSYRLTEAA